MSSSSLQNKIYGLVDMAVYQLAPLHRGDVFHEDVNVDENPMGFKILGGTPFILGRLMGGPNPGRIERRSVCVLANSGV